MDLDEQIRCVLTPEVCETEATQGRALAKLDSGGLLRADDPRGHFCVMFLPLDPASRQVLAVHHRHAGLWLFPGGHIEPGESLVETLTREVQEELGLPTRFPKTVLPFLISVTDGIRNVGRECTTHYDIWFLLEASPSDVNAETEEFLDSRWVGVAEAQTLIHDRACLSALERLPELGRG
jgi:8-oxo-dGTP pyrophosphatase MutT (NUDIX family)